MGRSNQTTDFKKTITPITNCRWFKIKLSAVKDQEKLETTVFYGKPDRSVFPDEASFKVAMGNFEANEADFWKAKANDRRTILTVNSEKAKEEAIKFYNTEEGHNLMREKYGMGSTATFKDTEIYVNSRAKYETKKYWDDLTHGLSQSFSGKLINYYHVSDTFISDGKVKQKWIAELFDFKSNEKYTFETTVAVIGRKIIDRICSLTTEDLQHDIRISLNRYESKIDNTMKATTEVYVLDGSTSYGRKLDGTFEVSVKDDNTGDWVNTPQGHKKGNIFTKADDTEFLSAFEMKTENGVDKPFVKFYKRISHKFQTKVLIPYVEQMFKDMGWEMEIKEKIETKTIAKNNKTIEEKTREIIYLTPIEVKEETPEAELPDGVADDVPF